MKKKSPAISTQLKAALAQIEVLKTDIAAVTKDRDEQKKTKENYLTLRSELEKEIEQVHILLDVLPGAAPRKAGEDNWRTPTYSLMTRLAAYLANRGPATPTVG